MNSNIHEFLKERRIEMKLSIQQLSKESGISASHISRMERGVRNASPQTLEKLAEPLNVGYVTLLKAGNLLDTCIRLEELLQPDTTLIFNEQAVSPKLKKQLLMLLEESYSHTS